MKFNKQFEIIERKRGDLLQLHRETCKNHYTHKIYIEKRSKIINSIDEKLPAHYKDYIRGFADGLIEGLYYDKVNWKHEYKGTLYNSWNDIPEEGKEFYRNGVDITLHSNFYWKNSFDIWY